MAGYPLCKLYLHLRGAHVIYTWTVKPFLYTRKLASLERRINYWTIIIIIGPCSVQPTEVQGAIEWTALGCGNPILDKKILSVLLCPCIRLEPPHGFRNTVDWRLLLEEKYPVMANLQGKTKKSLTKRICTIDVIKMCIFSFTLIFLNFFYCLQKIPFKIPKN